LDAGNFKYLWLAFIGSFFILVILADIYSQLGYSDYLS